MAISYIGNAAQSSGDSTSTAFLLPGTVADGDVAVVLLYLEASRTITAPGGQGYAELDPQDVGNGEVWLAYYGAVLQAADAGATHTFSWTGSIWRAGELSVFRGVDTTNLLDVANPPAGTNGPAGTTSLATPASATATDGAWAVWLVGTFFNNNHVWPGTNDGNAVTERVDAGNEHASATAPYPTAGTVSSFNVTWSSGCGSMVKTLLLRPAGGAAQDAPELRGRPFGQHGQAQMHQLLAQ